MQTQRSGSLWVLLGLNGPESEKFLIIDQAKLWMGLHPSFYQDPDPDLSFYCAQIQTTVPDLKNKELWKIKSHVFLS